MKNQAAFSLHGFACELEWSARGVTGFRFRTGGKGGRGDLARLARAGLPPFVADAVAMLDRYLGGEGSVDLSKARLDLGRAGGFGAAVYAQVRRIPAGATASYGQIAARAGNAKAARAVGAAMRGNRLPLFIPCHRVVRADGSPGGYTSLDGVALKTRLLEMERRP